MPPVPIGSCRRRRESPQGTACRPPHATLDRRQTLVRRPSEFSSRQRLSQALTLHSSLHDIFSATGLHHAVDARAVLEMDGAPMRVGHHGRLHPPIRYGSLHASNAARAVILTTSQLPSRSMISKSATSPDSASGTGPTPTTPHRRARHGTRRTRSSPSRPSSRTASYTP